jgi:hypothetical protein
MFNLNRYWIVLFVITLGYGTFEYYRPKPLDWSESYSNKDVIPFGSKALYMLLPDLFQKQSIQSLRIPPYNQLEHDSLLPQKSNYIFIQNNFSIDNIDQQALLAYVEKGNNVFISAYIFADSLMQVLGVDPMIHKPSLKDTLGYVNFVNEKLRDTKGFTFEKDDGRNYLKILDNSKVVALARNKKNEPVFVQVSHGKGKFFLHNMPLAFTNYYITDRATNQQAFRALSYLPVQPVFWDEYLKQGRFGKDENSIFRYIVSQPGLKTAYFLTLAGLLLFSIFTGKRKQRIIPTIKPPKNVSLEFVKTIGNMYYRKRDHAGMAEKLKQHFWLYVRDRFGIAARPEAETELFLSIAAKSGLAEADIQALRHELTGQDIHWTGKRLLDLNRRLEDFYERTR